MNLQVVLRKDKNWWISEAPALDLASQGKTKKEAAVMLADAVEMLVNQPGFKAEVLSKAAGHYLTTNHQSSLIALLLRRQRQLSGLTLAEVARRLGQSSPNTYARYEQGRSQPTVPKLVELLMAINPDAAPVLLV